jgi:hypothetical protein
MTVAELVEDLQRLPQDMLVWAEGTEIEGEVTRASVRYGAVLLRTEAFHGGGIRRRPT